MRRKSERVSKTVVEKKPEKSPKKTRGRASRRRKKSASTSPESSENEQFETSFRSSQEDTEEETSSGTSRTRRDRQKVVYTEAEVDAPDALDEVETQPKVFAGRTRRSSKKQAADEPEEQAKSETDDKSTDEAKAESSEQKHKEKEGKSSVWQVKSADCSSGEIKKLKLCIVRPQEVVEQSPKKHKKSRSSRSSAHRELAESEAGESSARDSSGERRKSRKSHRHTSASDDSTSPDKGKGKHKSGESSEDGHRTQDSSEELVAQSIKGNIGKPEQVEDATTDNETISIAVAGSTLGADSLETVKASNTLVQEENEPQQIRAETPTVAASQSAASSPDTKDDSSQSLDPFDKLTMEGSKPLKQQAEPSQEDVPSCDSTVQKPHIKIKEKEEILDEKSTECDSSLTPTVGASRSRDSSEERDLSKPGSTTETTADQKSKVLITEEAAESVPSSVIQTENIETNITVVEEKSPVVETPKESFSAVKLKRRSITVPDNVKPVSKITPIVQVEVTEASPALADTDAEHEVLELTAEVLLDSEKDISEPSREKSSDVGSSPATDSQESKPKSRRLNRSTTKDRQPITAVQTETAIPDETRITSNKDESEHKTPEKRKSTDEAKEDIQHTEPQTKPDKPLVKDVAEKKSETTAKPRRSRVVWEEKPSKPFVAEKPIVVVDRKRLRSTEEKSEKPTITVEKKRLHSTENSEQPSEAGETLEAVPVSKSYEKVTLKRSRKANADDENNAGAANNLADNEAVVPRKRPWGSKSSSSATKKPVLSISSDSLKTLVPEAKPLPISEVELTPDEDDEDEGEVDKDDEMSLFDETEQKNSHQIEEVPVREHSREVKLIFPTTAPDAQRVNVALPEEPRGKMLGGRKISIISDELRELQRSPSPPRHKKSDVLYMTNLVRPFTVNQIKDLLARTGTILEDGFWMDTIKSKCYVQYSSEAEAELTRKALHGVRWPASNPKQLCVDFAQRADMDKAKDGNQTNAKPVRKPDPQKAWADEQEEMGKVRQRERDRIERELEKIDKDRPRDKDADRHERGSKRVTNVREWDLGKMDGGPAEDGRQSREDRNKEKERRLRKDRSHRSQSPQDAPARKQKKKEEDAPAKLLDDLFRKTKLTPCIYWLPLTAEQIVVKEEIRRKHMAEHERRMAEMRKVEKERLRERMQGRPSQRRLPDRDKRSPKK